MYTHKHKHTHTHLYIYIYIYIYICTTLVQIVDEVGYISHCTNNIGKGMNPIILPPAMGK